MRFAGAAAVALAAASLSAVLPVTAAAATGPVFSTVVNGVPNGVLYSGLQNTVELVLRNPTAAPISMPSFTISMPASLSSITKGNVGGAGGGLGTTPGWRERCVDASCAQVSVEPGDTPPLGPPTDADSSVIPVSQPALVTFTVKPTATGLITFAVHSTDTTDLSVDTSVTINTVNGAVGKFTVTVAGPVVVGKPAYVTITARNTGGIPVPFPGGLVTVMLGQADFSPLALINGHPLNSDHRTFSFPIPPIAGGASYKFPILLTLAKPQTVTITDGSSSGTSSTVAVNAGLPTSLRINRIQDASHVPHLAWPVVNRLFRIDFAAYDQFGNVAPNPVVHVTLSAVNPGTGKFTVLTADPKTNFAGTGTAFATFNKVLNGLVLKVSQVILKPGTRSTNVQIAGDAIIGHPGLPAFLHAGFASSTLPSGAYGYTYLSLERCSTGVFTCHSGLEATVAGAFSNPANPAAHLYALLHPAVMRWTCPASRCPSPDSEGSDPGYASATGGESEQVEDFAAYPMQVSLKMATGYAPFAKAPSCRPLGITSQMGKTGAITNPAAIKAGFCVDVYAITRVGGTTVGALTLPVLFVEDPKIRGY